MTRQPRLFFCRIFDVSHITRAGAKFRKLGWFNACEGEMSEFDSSVVFTSNSGTYRHFIDMGWGSGPVVITEKVAVSLLASPDGRWV